MLIKWTIVIKLDDPLKLNDLLKLEDPFKVHDPSKIDDPSKLDGLLNWSMDCLLQQNDCSKPYLCVHIKDSSKIGLFVRNDEHIEKFISVSALSF